MTSAEGTAAYTGPACPVCASPGGQLLHMIPAVPVNSNLLMDSPADARAIPRGRIDLVQCDNCAYLANRAFDEGLIHYDTRYEDSQAFSATFMSYAGQLSRDWVADCDLTDRTVVEIGAGRGDFSELLAQAGAGRVIAMDPTIDLARFGRRDRRVEPLVGAFRAADDLPPCDAVVMRHVLEHISDPVALLTQLRIALAQRPDVPLLVEVPDATRILTEGAFWDVYYEHCAYVTPRTVRELFESCGFHVRALNSVYEGQYLLVTATATGATRAATLGDPELAAEREPAKHFSDAVRRELDGWRRRIQELPDGHEVVIWGSGSKGTAFLIAMGELADRIGRVVDVNPHLHGRFVAGTGHSIVAPDELADRPCDLVVVMNPVYLEEISQLVSVLSPGAAVTALGTPADDLGS